MSDVTIDPKTLDRLREDAERCSPGALSGLRVARHELLALLNAADRLPQVEAKRAQARLEADCFRGAGESLTRQVLDLEAERDALQAKLDKVLEIAGSNYFSAECRAAMNEVLEVLGDS